MTAVRAQFAPDPPPRTTLEGRASLAFKALALVNGFAVMLAFVPAVPVARLWTVSFNAASAALVVLMLLEARGLDRWRPWAVAVARPMLVIIAAAGTYQFVASLNGGRIRIPYDVVIAAWALLRGMETSPRPALSSRSLALAAGAVGLSAVMLFARPLFDYGGALDVRAADLHQSLAVDCGTPDAPGGVASVVTITYDWSWTSSSPLPDGLDSIVIGWDGDDGLGRPLYLVGPTPDPENGVHSGRLGFPSEAMEKVVAAESRGSWRWGVAMAERGYAPGHIVVTLERAQDASPDPQPLTIKGTYVHAGVWRQDVAPVTCSW